MLFKYSICSYSTISSKVEKGTVSSFKYSICSYSTYSNNTNIALSGSLNTASVLIQPIKAGCSIGTFCCLNTASVLIQQSIFDRFPVLSLFKYSICSYSTAGTHKWSTNITSLNTASVLIQR